MMIRSLAVSAAVLSLSAPAFSSPRLSDVSPDAWAYSALQNLAENYGCVAGYPDGMFRGDLTPTRYEAAALVSACLDRVYETLSEQDKQVADRAQAALNLTNTRVASLEAAAARKALEIGTYLGAGVNLNYQGVDGNGYEADRIVAGASIQGRIPVTQVFGQQVSVRPYFNFAAGPDSEIGSAMGALGTVDFSLASRNKVSTTNLYLGVGGQWALTNDNSANYQTSIGEGSQLMFVAGLERSLSPSLVGFADIKFPSTNNNAEQTEYNVVGTIGLGFKF